MYPIVPGDMMSGTLELVCYFCTVAAAVFSWLMTLRA